jgi:hypothetical protein
MARSPLVRRIARFRRTGYRILSVLGAFNASQSGSRAEAEYAERVLLGKAIRALTRGAKR